MGIVLGLSVSWYGLPSGDLLPQSHIQHSLKLGKQFSHIFRMDYSSQHVHVLTFCLASLSLKRSKSVRVARFFLMASFFDQLVFSHFSKMPSFSKAFLTGPERAAGASLTLKSVSDRCLKLIAWRQTLVHGPSTRACGKERKDGLSVKRNT